MATNNPQMMMRPARLPESFCFWVRPIICSVAAEMDDMSVPYPTQGMLDQMTDRAHEQIMRMFPGPDAAGQGTMQTAAGDPPPFRGEEFRRFPEEDFDRFGRDRFFGRDLVSVLLLNELLGRRRFFPFFVF